MNISFTIRPFTSNDIAHAEAVYTSQWGKLQRNWNEDFAPGSGFSHWFTEDGLQVELADFRVARDATLHAVIRTAQAAAHQQMH